MRIHQLYDTNKGINSLGFIPAIGYLEFLFALKVDNSLVVENYTDFNGFHRQMYYFAV